MDAYNFNFKKPGAFSMFFLKIFYPKIYKELNQEPPAQVRRLIRGKDNKLQWTEGPSKFGSSEIKVDKIYDKSQFIVSFLDIPYQFITKVDDYDSYALEEKQLVLEINLGRDSRSGINVLEKIWILKEAGKNTAVAEIFVDFTYEGLAMDRILYSDLLISDITLFSSLDRIDLNPVKATIYMKYKGRTFQKLK